MKLYVKSQTRSIDSYRERDEEGDYVSYGDWHEKYDFGVEGVYINPPYNIGYYEADHFEVDFDVTLGEIVYVLYMIYSTGDSFGRSEGNGEVLWVFKDATIAAKAHAKSASTEDYTLEFEVDGGKTVKISNPSYGYFEHCEALQLIAMNVQF